MIHVNVQILGLILLLVNQNAKFAIVSGFVVLVLLENFCSIGYVLSVTTQNVQLVKIQLIIAYYRVIKIVKNVIFLVSV